MTADGIVRITSDGTPGGTSIQVNGVDVIAYSLRYDLNADGVSRLTLVVDGATLDLDGETEVSIEPGPPVGDQAVSQ